MYGGNIYFAGDDKIEIQWQETKSINVIILWGRGQIVR